MLYDRIVDNMEIGRTIWKICRAFINDLYSVERFVLRWMTCTTLNGSWCVEWYVVPWMICTTLSDTYYVLYYVERFELRCMICTALNQRWIICSTALNCLYYVEWFILRWMICTMLNEFLFPWTICATSNDLYSVERFVLR